MSTALALAHASDRIAEPALRVRLNGRRAREADPVATAVSLNVLTCGSVDDGKSTLIGRLLWDTDGLPADQRTRLERSPKFFHHQQHLAREPIGSCPS